MILLLTWTQIWHRIEAALGKKLTEYETDKEAVLVFKPRVEEAQRHAKTEMKSLQEDRGGRKGAVLSGRNRTGRAGTKRRHDGMDAEEG